MARNVARLYQFIPVQAQDVEHKIWNIFVKQNYYFR